MIKIFINPGVFSRFADIIFKPLLIFCILTLFLGLIFALYLSPDDYQQGSTVRIMYIHVPSAWLSMLIFFIMTIYSIVSLAFKIPFGFIVNSAIAPIGATFTFICLFTGSLWGKPMWGTWWVWDARLTSVAVLFIIYLIIIFFRRSFLFTDVGEKITAVFIIVSSINLPIIKFSVDWWNTLHQAASISKFSSPSIDSSFMMPLITMTISFTCIGLLIAIIRINAEILNRKDKI
jgi:heme exporter protein C